MASDKYYRCCCGVHVHTFTFVVALTVVIVCTVASAIFIYNDDLIFAAVPFVPPLLAYGCLLVGNRRGTPGNYCPFLIVNLLIAVGMMLFAAFGYLTGWAFISHTFRIGSDFLETAFGTVSILTATGFALVAFLMFYYFYIVYRDYEYVKNELPKLREEKKTSQKEAKRPKRQMWIQTVFKPKTKKPKVTEATEPLVSTPDANSTMDSDLDRQFLEEMAKALSYEYMRSLGPPKRSASARQLTYPTSQQIIPLPSAPSQPIYPTIMAQSTLPMQPAPTAPANIPPTSVAQPNPNQWDQSAENYAIGYPWKVTSV